MRVCGAQRVLGRATIHGAVELSRHPLQDQLLALPLRATIQQAPPHSCPGEQGLWKHLILATPNPGGIEKREEEEKADKGGGGAGMGGGVGTLIIAENGNVKKIPIWL